MENTGLSMEHYRSDGLSGDIQIRQNPIIFRILVTSIFALLIVFLCPSLTKATASNGTINVLLNEKTLAFKDQSPVNIQGTVFVPMRGIFEALGAKVTWNEKERSVTGTLQNKSVFLRLDSRDAIINGDSVRLADPPVLLNTTTMVPIRIVSEGLGAEVLWSGENQTVFISSMITGSDSKVGPAAEKDENTAYGNATSNTQQLGLVVEKDGWIYYVSVNEQGKFELGRMRTDGTDYQKLLEKGVCSLNAVDDWLLFKGCVGDRSDHIYKMRYDGTELTEVDKNTVFVRWMYYYNGWIYYVSADKNGINRMRMDGTSNEEISADFLINVSSTIGDDWIYYTDSLNKKLKKMRLDGSDAHTIFEDRIALALVVDQGWVYFSEQPAGGSLIERVVTRMRLDGTEEERIVGGDELISVNNFTVQNGVIYYVNLYNMCLYKRNIEDDSAATMVTNKQIKRIYTITDGLYLQSYEGDWYFVDKDGNISFSRPVRSVQ
ncbi:DUF5050 domain-containing protein [Paenibacillus chondroitinus]|uniref:DUF5050 domain-containing protein n=1 Tax=Paenibacillus chondroitinus TaxID=59842 RepID=A0ABU6DAC3_9BACL|nr:MULTISPECIES: DUF5050 domain-containing protein [Paenibacillus]MCY9662267.1 DUF5050 domain-containing protein [Paenibacillus anseongense]MEB4794695.1 DUF5050 domain-containing protein [Paenibacillus chondroitinus]